MRRVGWVVLAAALTGGCFRTTVRSGQPPWHSPLQLASPFTSQLPEHSP